MPQYIENASVNIGLVDPRDREVKFRILGTTKRIELPQAYDGMDLIIDGIKLGKYSGPCKVNTEDGEVTLTGGFIGYVDLDPDFIRPDVTEKEITGRYGKLYGKLLDRMYISKVQHIAPKSILDFQPDFFD
jgi:hypothetical protein